jgi:hypothetical protein
MKSLGITYTHSTPQSLGDQWWFWNCENLPDPLPDYLEPLNDSKGNPLDPFKCIGWGLSEQEARWIDIYGRMINHESKKTR